MIKRDQIEPIIALPNSSELNLNEVNKLISYDNYANLYYIDSYNNAVKLVGDGYTLISSKVDGNIISWDGYNRKIYAGFVDKFYSTTLDPRWSINLGDPADSVTPTTDGLEIITTTTNETYVEAVGILPSLPMTIQWYISRDTIFNLWAGIRLTSYSGDTFSFGNGANADRIYYELYSGSGVVNYGGVGGGWSGSGWLRLHLSSSFWKLYVSSNSKTNPPKSDDDFVQADQGFGAMTGNNKYFKFGLFLTDRSGSVSHTVYFSNLSIRSG
jgi:hypothetical protein